MKKGKGGDDSESGAAYVLIGDLVGSREARNRRALSRRIENAIALLSTGCKGQGMWRAPLMTTRGIDELSGVLRKPTWAFDVSVALNTMVWPHRFRFALAWGPIDVAWRTRDAAAMDGPAFHQASDAMERARRDGLGFAIDLPETQHAACRVVEELCRVHQTLMQRWSKEAAKTVQAYRELEWRSGTTGGRVTQAGVAHRLGKTQQAVSEALQRAHFMELIAAEVAVHSWLDTIN